MKKMILFLSIICASGLTLLGFIGVLFSFKALDSYYAISRRITLT